MYPRDKWAISEISDLTRGEPGWGVLGVWESPAWIYNCVLTRGEPGWDVLGVWESPARIYNYVLTNVGHSGKRG